MSRCACDGKLRLSRDLDVPNLYRMVCSSPWHEFPLEALGDVLPAEIVLAAPEPRLAAVTDEWQEDRLRMVNDIASVLTRALGRPTDDDTDESGSW